MGIDVYWRDDGGKDLGLVSDSQMLFSRFIASSPWSGTACLRFIDAAGDAILNQLQVPGRTQWLLRGIQSPENILIAWN